MTQPNLLFLFPDQWRWDWLGCETSPYGKVPVHTPNIDALAKRGVRFTQCRANSPVCAPSRACLSQGVRYEKCHVPSNSYDTPLDVTTVWNLLRDAGYRTLTCGKNDLHKKTKWKGHDGWTQRLGQYGFCDAINQSGKMDAVKNGSTSAGGPHCSYTSYLHAQGLFDLHHEDYVRRTAEATWSTAPWPSPLDREHYTDDFCGRMALDLLNKQPDEGPWSLWVNFPGPHDPFDPPRELQQLYDGVMFPEPINGKDQIVRKDGQTRTIDHQQLRRNYAACCQGIDQWVGRIVDAVQRRGELENTLIIFASDHGEMLGDHGRWTKTVPHEASVHVPLIVAGPGIPQNEVRDDLVELIDVAALMLQAAKVNRPDTWDARSPLGDPSPARDYQLSSLANWRLIYDGRYKLIITKDPDHDQDQDQTASQTLELFDLTTDPEELHDLAPSHPDMVQKLKTILDGQTSNR